jgi:tRNA modification GTPase
MILHDTICALATPPGIGGLAVVRLSGAEAIAVAEQCFVGKRALSSVKSHTIHYGNFVQSNQPNTVIDTVTASVFRMPHSYTGENTVEFGCHGGMIVASDIIHALISAGARMAQAGEFTKRAFLNRKLDLTQAEAVADMIHAVSTRGAQTATRQLLGGLTTRLQELRLQLMDICGLLELELDFADEGIELIDRSIIRERLQSTQTFCNNLALSFRASEIVRSGYTVRMQVNHLYSTHCCSARGRL